MQIIPLSEGSFTIDQSKVFVPFNNQTEVLQSRPVGSLLVEIQPFVIVTKKDIILKDTCHAYTNTDVQLQLHENLEKAGIKPAAVTKVLMSHLHKDHAGGTTFSNIDNTARYISFPYATYYIQKREFEYATGIGSASYIPEDILPLAEFSKVVWLNGDEGEIDGGIKYQVTGAHSKFHQVFWITEDNETIFFGGDDAPQLQQMKSKFVAKYDYDGKKCMELRQGWLEKAKQEGWTFLFYHDIATPIWDAR
jgi:glyoxylase-like metal-dependent hydrolase (beta-lactamase superfamily II)